MILILMGVSGIGKTTLGQLLTRRTGWPFEDADDFHPESNKRKMAAGIPLNDADRAPWLAALHRRMVECRAAGQSVILACSALKEGYRKTLAEGFTAAEMRFVYLHAPEELIAEHIAKRHHQYMNPNLLRSQLDTLEEPTDANTWPVAVTGTPEEAVDVILSRLRGVGALKKEVEKQ